MSKASNEIFSAMIQEVQEKVDKSEFHYLPKDFTAMVIYLGILNI